MERVEGSTTLRAGRLRIEGVAIRCADVALGRASQSLAPTHSESSLGGYRVDDGLELRAEPRLASDVVRISSLEGAAHELIIVERRGIWARLLWPISDGLALHGWVRIEADRETAYASGTGGFEGRSASIPRPIIRTEGCYLGPAFFRRDAPVYAHEDDTRSDGALSSTVTGCW